LKGAVGSAPRLWNSPLHSWYVLLRPFSDEKEVTTQPSVKEYPYSFFLTISLSPTLLTGLLSPFRCLLDQCRSFFFKFSHLFGLISNFFGLELCELLLSPKTFSIATTALTLPVLEFSIAISLALIISSASLVALIGWVSVDFKSMPEGCFNLRRLSTQDPVLLDQLS
jgi:hypothetical protein